MLLNSLQCTGQPLTTQERANWPQMFIVAKAKKPCFKGHLFREVKMGCTLKTNNTHLFFYFNWSLITLQYCSGFCHTLTWISHACICVPHPESPSHLLPHHIPLGCPSAPALSALFHASNLDWSSVSHLVQCYSLKSSHPCPLPQSPKVCSLHLCLFCCLAYRVVTIFLNSIYMC